MNLNENNDNLNHQECILNGKALGTVEEYKHMHVGVTRYCNLKIANKCLVEEKIQSARRTAYALMGAGFHRRNGLNPKVTKTIYKYMYCHACSMDLKL